MMCTDINIAVLLYPFIFCSLFLQSVSSDPAPAVQCEPLVVFKSHESLILDVKPIPYNYTLYGVSRASGSTFISSGGDGWVALWDKESSFRINQWKALDVVQAVEVLPNNQFLVAYSFGEYTSLAAQAAVYVKLWRFDKSESVRGYTKNLFCVVSLAYLGDGTFVAGPDSYKGCESNPQNSGKPNLNYECKLIRRYNIDTGVQLNTYAAHSDAVPALVPLKNGNFFLSGSWDGKIKRWNPVMAFALETYNFQPVATSSYLPRVLAIAVLDESYFFATGQGNVILKFKIGGGSSPIFRYDKVHTTDLGIWSMAMVGTSFLVTGDGVGLMYLWQIDRKDPVAKFNGGSSFGILALTALADGSFIAGGEGVQNYYLKRYPTNAMYWTSAPTLTTTDYPLRCCTVSKNSWQFVSEACVPGNKAASIWGTDTVLSNCTAPIDGQFVSQICERGTALHTGTDTVIDACSEPVDGSYVKATCSRGAADLVGSDTAVSSCTAPQPLEYIILKCVSGNSKTVGRNTERDSVSEVVEGYWVATPYNPGDIYTKGSDRITVPCSDPSPNHYVTSVCVNGNSTERGHDTVFYSCSSVPNANTVKIKAACSPGSYHNLGTDNIFTSKCPVGYTLNGTDYSCNLCPYPKSTAVVGADTCSVCIPGYYMPPSPAGSSSNPDRVCTPCPVGGDCTGLLDRPFAAPGWIATSMKEVFMRCIPPESCLSFYNNGSTSDYQHRPTSFNNVQKYCSLGYTGIYCNTCYNDGVSFPRYYRSAMSGSKCLKCSESENLVPVIIGYLLLAFFLVGVGIAVYIRFRLRKQVLNSLITFLQLLATVNSLNLKWTPSSQFVLKLAIPFNFNLEVLSPECAVKLSYLSRWIMIQVLPLVGLAILLIVHLFTKYFNKQLVQCTRRVRPNREVKDGSLVLSWNAMLVKMLSMLNLLYLQMVVNTFAVFDCVKSSEAVQVMNTEPTIVCDGDRDATYKTLLPLASVSLVVYVIGIPLIQSILLYIGHKKCSTRIATTPVTPTSNKSMRSSSEEKPTSNGEGSKRKSILPNRTVTSFYEILMQDVYQRYKVDMYYWKMVDMLRKLAVVAVIRIVSSEEALMQGYLLCTVFIFTAFMQHNSLPYNDAPGDGDRLNKVEYRIFMVLTFILIIGMGMLNDTESLEKLEQSTETMNSDVAIMKRIRLNVSSVMILLVMIYMVLYVGYYAWKSKVAHGITTLPTTQKQGKNEVQGQQGQILLQRIMPLDGDAAASSEQARGVPEEAYGTTSNDTSSSKFTTKVRSAHKTENEEVRVLQVELKRMKELKCKVEQERQEERNRADAATKEIADLQSQVKELKSALIEMKNK